MGHFRASVLYVYAVTRPRGLALENALVLGLDSPALEAFLTSPIWSDRILGVSQNRCFPSDTLVMITSNGLTSTPDAARRFVWIALEWFGEDITHRRFAHTDLIGHALEFRQRYYSALMSMVRGWWKEGQPEADVSMPTFDRWARAVGGILKVAAVEGFLENRDEASAELDPEGADMRELVKLWVVKYPDREVLTKDLFQIATDNDLFPWITAGKGNEKSQQIRLGKLLVKYRNRTIGGWTITEPQPGSRPPKYFLRRA